MTQTRKSRAFLLILAATALFLGLWHGLNTKSTRPDSVSPILEPLSPNSPTPSPIHSPTPSPIEIPTHSPTYLPTPSPTELPTHSPSYLPTPSPTMSLPTAMHLIPWQKIGNDIDGEAWGDFSGSSVSLSADGNIVAIGAYGNDDNGGSSGHVRIFQWTESTSAWTQVGADIDGEERGDKSGSSVSLSSDGKTVAIGSEHNDGNGDRSGHVRIFRWNHG
jgi:hypothetical protein